MIGKHSGELYLVAYFAFQLMFQLVCNSCLSYSPVESAKLSLHCVRHCFARSSAGCWSFENFPRTKQEDTARSSRDGDLENKKDLEESRTNALDLMFS